MSCQFNMPIYMYLYSCKYVIDSDQHPDTNRSPLLPNSHLLTSLSQITIRFNGILENQHSFQILRSMADLLVKVRIRAYVIGRLFGKWETAIDLRIERLYENWKKDINLRYRCLWCRNRTWIWGLDVD